MGIRNKQKALSDDELSEKKINLLIKLDHFFFYDFQDKKEVI